MLKVRLFKGLRFPLLEIHQPKQMLHIWIIKHRMDSLYKKEAIWSSLEKVGHQEERNTNHPSIHLLSMPAYSCRENTEHLSVIQFKQG